MSISLTTEAFTALVVLGTAASFTPGPNTTLSETLRLLIFNRFMSSALILTAVWVFKTSL